jgi:hypothetical protein
MKKRRGDGKDSSTSACCQVCVWVPVALSYHDRHSMSLSPEDPAPVVLPGTESPWV